MSRHPASTLHNRTGRTLAAAQTRGRAGARIRPLFKDLLSVGLATLFASGAAFTLGVLVPRVEQRTVSPASHTPPPPPGEGVYSI